MCCIQECALSSGGTRGRVHKEGLGAADCQKLQTESSSCKGNACPVALLLLIYVYTVYKESKPEDYAWVTSMWDSYEDMVRGPILPFQPPKMLAPTRPEAGPPPPLPRTPLQMYPVCDFFVNTPYFRQHGAERQQDKYPLPKRVPQVRRAGSG